MDNLYNYKEPVSDPKQFIGRKAMVSKIYARIGAGRPQSVSIVGDLKIGKTSLLSYLACEDVKREMLSSPDDYIFLFIPCKKDNSLTLGSLTALIYRMSKKYAENSGNDSMQIEYNYFKKLVENLHRQDKKIILFFDDFNLITLNPAFPLEFFSFLRSLANNYNLAYITTSYEDLQKLCVSKDIEESPFFNIFTNMSLRGFESSEIDSLIQLSEQGEYSLENEKDYLIGLTGSSPYPLQMACNLLNSLKNQNGHVDEGIKFQFESDLEENLLSYHTHLWNHMGETHKSILSCLAFGRNIPAVQQYLLRDLSKKSYIISNNGKTEFASLLLKKFVYQNSDPSVYQSSSVSTLGKLIINIKRFFNN
jgi:serine/threonine-protein kinase